jgi:hypothetical protein
MAEGRRAEVVDANWTPDLTKDRARRLLQLLFRPAADGERGDDGLDESREGEAA